MLSSSVSSRNKTELVTLTLCIFFSKLTVLSFGDPGGGIRGSAARQCPHKYRNYGWGGPGWGEANSARGSGMRGGGHAG